MSDYSRLRLGRIAFSVIFASGALVNVYFVLASPGIYEGFADLALLPAYRELWASVVLPNLPFMIGLVAGFEILLAVLLLIKGRPARIGLFMAAVFMLLLFPFWWAGGALVNLLLAALLLRLAFSGA